MASNEAWDAALSMVHDAGAAAVQAMAETAKARTMALVPVEEGELKGSFQVDQDDLDATMGTDVPYAIYVHEDLKDQHPRGGQAKFMEAAVTGSDSVSAIGTAAADAAEAAMG